MSQKRFPEDIKIEAVKQITQRPFSGRGVRPIGCQSAQSVQVDQRAAIASWSVQGAVVPNGGTAQTQGLEQAVESKAAYFAKLSG